MIDLNVHCPHVEGSFVRFRGDPSRRIGQVTRRSPNLDGWTLHVQFADGSVEPWPCTANVETVDAPDGILSLGSAGEDVAELQSALEEANFSPGKIDGEFELATRTAVKNFQRSQDFAATGIADSVTLQALGIERPNSNDVWDLFTPLVVARMFATATPLSNIKNHLPRVVGAMRSANLVSRSMALMALATIRAETERFAPISEGRSRYNTSPNGHDFDLYDFREDLGNKSKGDGALFRGRGFVQLTGRHNYKALGKAVKVDLITYPDKANDPDVAAAILARFLKAREQRIEQALLHRDLRLARRLVNGGIHGMDRFTEAFGQGESLVPA